MASTSQHTLKKGGKAKETRRKKDTDGKDTENRKRAAADMYEMCRDGTFDDKRYICSVLDKMSLRVNTMSTSSRCRCTATAQALMVPCGLSKTWALSR